MKNLMRLHYIKHKTSIMILAFLPLFSFATIIPTIYFAYVVLFKPFGSKDLSCYLATLPIDRKKLITTRYLFYFLVQFALLLYAAIVLTVITHIMNDFTIADAFYFFSLGVGFAFASFWGSGVLLAIIPNIKIKYRILWGVGIYFCLSISLFILKESYLPIIESIKQSSDYIREFSMLSIGVLVSGIILYWLSYAISQYRTSRIEY